MSDTVEPKSRKQELREIGFQILIVESVFALVILVALATGTPA